MHGFSLSFVPVAASIGCSCLAVALFLTSLLVGDALLGYRKGTSVAPSREVGSATGGGTYISSSRDGLLGSCLL